MVDEGAGQLDDPTPRAVRLSWVWRDRYLLEIGDVVSVVITGAEVGRLADEAVREAGRNGVLGG